MRVAARVDSHKFITWLTKAQRKQIPFATAKALTVTASQAVQPVKANLRKKFILRRPWTEKGISYKRAEKRDWPHVRAEIGSRDSYMERHEEGGVKKPKNEHIALPRAVRSNIRKLVPRKYWPRNMSISMKTPQGGRPRGSRNGSRRSPMPFVAIPRSKKMGIYIRTRGYFMDNAGRRRQKYKLLYRLRNKPVKIEKKEWLRKTVQAIASKRLEKNFEEEFRKALYSKK